MVSGSRVNKRMVLINPKSQVCVSHIGNEQSPLLVINACWTQPQQLREWAGDAAGFIHNPADYYPGVRKPVNEPLKAALLAALSAHLQPVWPTLYGEKRVSLTLPFCAYSLTNQPAESLIPIQRVPHFDTTTSLQFALVAYLFEGDKGGTAFYRHRKTGFEVIADTRVAKYMKTLHTEASTVGLPKAGYITQSTPLFEQFHSGSGQWNKSILYTPNLLHSGNIDKQKSLVASTQTGRLTLNACLRVTFLD